MPDELVGRKIADSIWAVYASRAYIDRYGKPELVEDLSLHPLVGFDEALSNHRTAQAGRAGRQDGGAQ